MSPFYEDLRLTMVPGVDPKHGPLPPLLVGMTVVTGLVDAFSYLVLGHVFVANMTGNVVFLGFALARAPGFSIWASLAALASFWLGAYIGGTLGSRFGEHRGRLLAVAIALEASLLAGATVLAAISGTPVSAAYRYPLIIVLAVALGNQNATARRLAVPDLTTTVLTLTITGTAADSPMAGGKRSTAVRRFISVFSMFFGALIGALLVVHGMAVVALAIAFGVLVMIAVVVAAYSEPDSPWATR